MTKKSRRDFVNIVVSVGGVLTTVSLPAFLLQSCKTGDSNSGLLDDDRSRRDASRDIGATAQATALDPSLRVRKSAFDSTNQNVAKYAEAVRRMKARTSNGRTWWELHAQIHQDHCPHGNWYFLPWHRAYLYYFEQVCMNVLNDQTFALPYWDWEASGHNVLPPPAVSGGELEHNPRQLRGPSINQQFVGPSAMDRVMAPNDFISFGSGRTRRTRGANGASAPLESMPHNNTHVWVSGDMATFMSPRDPVFWMHHANIDRIWASWSHKQKMLGRSELPPNPGPGLGQVRTSTWLNERMGDFYVVKGGTGGAAATLAAAPKLTVRSLIDYEKAQGYVYDNLVQATAPAGFSLAEDATPSARNLQMAASEMEPKFHVVLPLKLKGNPTINAPAKSLTFVIDVAGSKVKLPSGQTMSGVDLMARFAATAIATANDYAKQPGLKMYVDNVPVPRKPDETQLLFFLNEQGGQSGSETSPSFLGAHGFFGHDHAGHANHGLSLVFDLVNPLKNRQVVIAGEAKVTVYVKSPLADLPADLQANLKKMKIKIEYYDFNN